jgi:uncharacterized phage protein (TIGR02220 family)
MAIVRAARKGNFTVINNKIFDSGLSARSIGVLTFLLSKPDNWEVSPAQLVKRFDTEDAALGRDAIYACLNELIKHGYVERRQGRGKSGKLGSNDYFVFDEPLTDLPYTAETMDLPHTDLPYTAKTTLINTDLKTNTEVKRSSVAQSTTEPKSKSNSGDIKSVVDHLNQLAGSKFQAKGQAEKLINARLSDGFTLQDLRLVIEHKVSEWGKSAKMCQYLRPTTLFNTNKFPGYLAQAKAVQNGLATQSGNDWIPDDESTDWANNLYVSP